MLPLLFVGEDQDLVKTTLCFIAWIDAAFILLFIAFSNVKIRQFLSFDLTRFREVSLALVLLVPILAINYAYHFSLIKFFSIQDLDGYTSLGLGLFGMILYIVVLPGIFEELAFRGILQQKFGKILSRSETYVIVSALFAIAHLNLFSAPYYFGLSLFLCHVRTKTNSLLPCIIIHALHNLVVVLVEYFEIVKM